MRTTQFCRIATLAMAALLAPVLVSAQQIQPVEEKPADKTVDKPADKAGKAAADKSATAKQTAEPKLEKLEDPEPPSIKIGKPPGEPKVKVTETRNDSRGREVKVENGKSTYYVRPNAQVGSTLPGDTQSTTNRGAEWKVMEFDLGAKKKKEDDKSDSGDVKK